jgi:hypothetical protein
MDSRGRYFSDKITEAQQERPSSDRKAKPSHPLVLAPEDATLALRGRPTWPPSYFRCSLTVVFGCWRAYAAVQMRPLSARR